MSSQYGELWPTSGGSIGSLGHPCKCQRVSRLGFVTAATSHNGGQLNIARCLAVSWAGTPYIHFWGLLPPDGILPVAKFTHGPSLCSPIYCATLEQRASAKLQHGTRNGIAELLQRAPPMFGWAAITLGIRPHSS